VTPKGPIKSFCQFKGTPIKKESKRLFSKAQSQSRVIRDIKETAGLADSFVV